ncbi:MAG TPA: serine/threonine-protein kinase, partial [Gemmata sp.]|nr:serine/threonine-protein kinase [Gemmata sp.]
MSDDPRVNQLLDELVDTSCTPEEICVEFPELLPEVRDRLQQMRLVQAELDAMFPRSGESLSSSSQECSTLPQIPGYEVETILGSGGMGIVFRAKHMRLNRVVALKMALAGAYAGQHERERFQREAEAVAALRHPNVVQIYDIGESAGRPYFTMEFVEGGSLAEKLQGTPLPSREAAAILATLAEAIHVAHEGGIVHRDLKPANIMLTSDGKPKITDFGLARRLGGEAGLTRTGLALGTPSYMAPEQARGRIDALGPAVDIYALGAILYELLTGRPPFRAETASETVYQLLTQDPVPPSRLNGNVPRDLETVCLQCLQKEPKRRYTSSAALADDLTRYLLGQVVAARPVGQLERAGKWIRRNKWVAGLAVATVLALVCGTVASLLFAFKASRGEELATTRAGELQQKTIELEAQKRDNERVVIAGLLIPIGRNPPQPPIST